MFCKEQIKNRIIRNIALFIFLSVFVATQMFSFYWSWPKLYADKETRGILPLVQHIRQNRHKSSQIIFEHHGITWLLLYYAYDNPLDAADIENSFYNMDTQGKVNVDHPYMTLQSIMPHKDFETEADLDNKTYQNLLSLSPKQYWFILDKFRICPPVKDYVRNNCGKETSTEEYELYFCDLENDLPSR